MARIRSIHPGLATDEIYMGMSVWAKAAWPILWTECDDHGVFEWKPIVLKARIFPADNINFEQILEEWQLVDCIRAFEFEGKRYGVVRNFCRFQKPKKPNFKHPLPDEYRTYIGLKAESTEPVPHQFPTSTEKSVLMEMEMEEEVRKKRKKEIHYAFESGIIRLTEKHFNQWKQCFSYLDLGAELIQLTAWAEQQGPDHWFQAVAGALNKRNRVIKESRERPPKPDRPPHLEGIL